ncbi:DUF3617 family protein [Sphingomonas sp. BK235]|uniref:DUF3617 domain-containing protein n=1 Tax=Sphingomonas sp. BK235 TaxID=2512131 RepID=UPI00104544D0|nr:DUF3617 family protein [Sphingomonas sp. BK235]TCP30062.1 hypothetical protein EV292_1146 [Sphingomonas sp. BK235]
MRLPIAIVSFCAGLSGNLAFGAVSAASPSDAPIPGAYRVTSTVKGAPSKVSDECMSADEIAELFALRPMPGYCVMARDQIGRGRIDLARSCRSGAQVRSASISGSYSPTAFDATTSSRLPELPEPLEIRLRGQRTGGCEAD